MTIPFRNRKPAPTWPQSPGTVRSLALVLALILSLGACAQGEYRLPYVDSTDVTITANHNTHTAPPKDMYDMVADQPPGFIVAAAAGWVRFIEDGHTQIGGGPNNFVWIEHPYPYCQDPLDSLRAGWPGKSPEYDQSCTPCDKAYCNEWTVYAHFVPGTVTGDAGFGAGLSVGDWVEAGDYLGMEGAVGQTDGVPHLHWHIAVIDPTITPDEFGYYQEWLDDAGVSDPELIPRVCHADGTTLLFANGSYTAAACP